MPISRQAAMTRTAISPRLAIKTELNIVTHPCRAALLQEGADALLALRADPQVSDGRGGGGADLIAAEVGDVAGEQLGGAHPGWPALADVAQCRGNGVVESGGGDNLMDEANRQRPLRIEPLRRDEERPRRSRPNLGNDELRDDGGSDAQPRLSEAKPRVLGGNGDVADSGQPGAAAERRALDAANHRMAAVVDPPEHVGHLQRVLDVLLAGIGDAGAHPVEVGARAE